MLLFFSVGKGIRWWSLWLSTGLGRAVSAEFNSCQALRQRVAHVLIALGQKLLLFICAGQRVAAVVGAHVQGGIHWVGEVGGLWSKGNYMATQTACERQRSIYCTLQWNKVQLTQKTTTKHFPSVHYKLCTTFWFVACCTFIISYSVPLALRPDCCGRTDLTNRNVIFPSCLTKALQSYHLIVLLLLQWLNYTTANISTNVVDEYTLITIFICQTYGHFSQTYTITFDWKLGLWNLTSLRKPFSSPLPYSTEWRNKAFRHNCSLLSFI